MARLWRLEIQGSSNHTFDIDGEFTPTRILVYDDASTDTTNYQAEPIELRDVWEIRGAKLRAATVEALWDSIHTFKDRFATSGSTRATSFPSYAKIVRDPDGTPADEWVLGPSTYEGFRVEEIRFGAVEESRGETFGASVSVDMRMSASIRQADTNGLVGWRQSVEKSYGPDGLLVLTWRTRITTQENTSAETKAQSYAAIPTSALSGDDTYLTNGPYGVDITIVDAKEQSSRVPTVVECVSTVKQWGISTGATSAQGSPGEVDYSVTTEVTPDETITTTTAAARGPGALSWVRDQAPVAFNTKREISRTSHNEARCEWVKRASRYDDALSTSRIEITGGHQAKAFWPTIAKFRPVLAVGAFLPWEAVVTVTVEKRGSDLTPNDMRFPGKLPAPWVFFEDESYETEPERVELAPKDQSRTGDLWRREAKLVFRSADKPTFPLLAQIAKATAVERYLTGAVA